MDPQKILADVGANKDDNYFRGLGFERGRQDALDYLARVRDQTGGITLEEKQNKARQQQMEAIKPAVDSLQAQIPEIGAKYAQTRQQLTASQKPLEERYQSLLDSIKNQGTQDVNQQTKITNNELGKRGITGSSTLAQQEIQNTTSPLRQKYTGLEKDTTLAREDAIRALQDQLANLTPQETADQRAITQAIANLQAGAGQAGISQGMQLYSTDLQNQFQKQQMDQQNKQQAIQDALTQAQANQKQTQLVEIGGRTKLIDTQTGNVIQDLGVTKLASSLNAGGGGATSYYGGGSSQGRYSIIP